MFIFYDFEVFKHDWLVCFKEIKNTNRNDWVTIVNDRERLLEYYNEHKNDLLIGYNCNHYDKFIYNYILATGRNPYPLSKRIIDGNSGYTTYNRKYPIVNYDCMTDKTKGLKTLELFMGENIKESDIPFDIDRKLTEAEIDEVIKYCMHDVAMTQEVFLYRFQEFKTSFDLIKKYKLPFNKCIGMTNGQLTAEVLGCTGRPLPDGEIKIIESIDCGKYRDLVEPLYNLDILNYDGMLECEISGIPHKLGKGGVHGCKDKPVRITTSDSLEIMHIDVNSFYPSLMIMHDILTRQAKNKGDYKAIFDERIKLKKEGKKDEQSPLKVVLNTTFGISKYEYSKAYDPSRCWSVTLNGQLMLIDLIDKLEVIKSFDLIQSNTDGIIITINPEDKDEVYSICHDWESRHGITLGYDNFTYLYQRDVNNYVAVFDSGKIETKGIEVKVNNPLDNNLAIKNIAIREYLLNGTPVRDTVYNNRDNLILFQQQVKKSKYYKHLLYGDEILPHKYYRIFATTDKNGKKMYKQKLGKNKEEYADTPSRCVIINDKLTDIVFSDLDLEYYIEFIEKKLKRWEIE